MLFQFCLLVEYFTDGSREHPCQQVTVTNDPPKCLVVTVIDIRTNSWNESAMSLEVAIENVLCEGDILMVILFITVTGSVGDMTFPGLKRSSKFSGTKLREPIQS